MVGPMIMKTREEMDRELEDQMAEGKRRWRQEFRSKVDAHAEQIRGAWPVPEALRQAQEVHRAGFDRTVADAGGRLDHPSVLDWAARSRAFSEVAGETGPDKQDPEAG
jgi:hypothetical protein